MSSEFFLKKGNRLPVLQAQFEDYNGYINLSGASVEFLYRFKPTGTTISRNATVLDATNGLVQYSWVSGDVQTPGVYWAEWKATYSDGKTITIPNDSYITFEIISSLD